MPFYDYKCENCGVMELCHSIKQEALTICPQCGGSCFERLITWRGSIIWSGREANQYEEVKYAKYWRDKNGVRHKVTPQDGSVHSNTVKRQTVSDEVVEGRKKASKIIQRQRRKTESYRRTLARQKRQQKQRRS